MSNVADVFMRSAAMNFKHSFWMWFIMPLICVVKPWQSSIVLGLRTVVRTLLSRFLNSTLNKLVLNCENVRRRSMSMRGFFWLPPSKSVRKKRVS